MKDPVRWTSLVVAALAAVILFFLPATHTEKLQLAAGYSLLFLVFFFGLVVLAKMATGAIDLTRLVSEAGGGASMSRFQLLIFTFVVGLSFFIVVVAQGKLPDIPPNVLLLLGISATTYGVGKGIQATGGLSSKEPAPPPPPGGGETK